MNQSLSEYFSGIGAKRLSNVEVNPKKSNQHEFGSNKFCEMLGTEKKTFPGKIIYLSDDPDETIIEEKEFSWYDTRLNNPKRSAEFRLYYPDNSVVTEAKAGDLLIIGKTKKSEELLIIIAEKNSTAEHQLIWLFNLGEVGNSYKVENIDARSRKLDFAGKFIIETLGVEVQEDESDYLEELLSKFGGSFPKTSAFSQYARKTLKNEVSPLEEPDETLIAWLDREELLFRTLERHLVSQRLASGFGEDGADVDQFIKYSLSIQNRRKSRAGHSFENHLAAIFDENRVNYSKGQKTERNNKPDFLFPGIEQYRDLSFSVENLNMLGVKTTTKDRWRQVLSEAERIDRKHLITLQPAISENQTEEMIQQNLQLVIPEPIMPTYTEPQRKNLINLKDFINVVLGLQS